MQKSRGHCGRAAHLAGVTEDDVVPAEQLRKVVRRKPYPPLRQVEAELMSHWPAQPRIDARRRRPDALDQPSDNDPVRFRKPRLQRSIDFQLNLGRLGPSYDAIAKRGLKHFGIITERDQQSAG